jgi:GH15 family glucan-1,4-alpha-glucosidase
VRYGHVTDARTWYDSRGMTQLPIGDYALLSDCHSAALVSRTGSVDWLCFPRFDGPSVFARILDEQAGHWSINPRGDFEVSRHYQPETMIMETTFFSTEGTVRVIDTMAVGRNERGHELGCGAPSTLLRVLEGVAGQLEIDVEFAPRPEYGLVSPLLSAVDGGVCGAGGADRLSFSSPIPLDIAGATARGSVHVRAGDRFGFALQHRSSSQPPPELWSQAEIEERLTDTADAWRTWSVLHQAYDGPARELVHHSGRVLYSLTYYPTGAMCAAPTTSLPESVGGARNWDYRYAWVRDASFTLKALWVAACPDEADKFFDYLSSAAAAQVEPGELQIMFGLGGERDLTERELPHLRGWRGSSPVRVGNGAWQQRQLDVFGELLDAAARLPVQVARLGAAGHAFLRRLADAAATRWREPDQGIWEMRDAPRHFVYSKLMCWVALDRALDLAGIIGAEDRVEEWKHARDEIAEAILSQGWSDSAGAFTQSFESDALDASNLMMPIVGFLPADDPRMRSTIDAIADRLTDRRGLVFRYLSEDGLEGDEGTFLLCTFWLVQALAQAGETARARETFERAISFANDVGLLAEEVDPNSGELLGNFPQAFSHVGLVNAAWALVQAGAGA